MGMDTVNDVRQSLSPRVVRLARGLAVPLLALVSLVGAIALGFARVVDGPTVASIVGGVLTAVTLFYGKRPNGPGGSPMAGAALVAGVSQLACWIARAAGVATLGLVFAACASGPQSTPCHAMNAVVAACAYAQTAQESVCAQEAQTSQEGPSP